MSLESSEGLALTQRKNVWVRIQEFDPDGNGRPYEEDMTDYGLHADSVGDLPLPGDFLGLETKEMTGGTMENPEFTSKGGVYKVLTRFLDFQMIQERLVILCNIVVQRENDRAVIGRLIKD
ncbi:hypothetical protein [Mucilaginibacter rubeus]|uniref:Uncharacterized protein n=1 Tax=Mucilaginibacter rubeus TaxID=2027860 RepID=A0A5C1HT27_9SPHI|nr:hypothetical protein [Mucilaginibacter rubeus]QEM09187.1 hypothetical protein DEO27_003870 [Mucilaginibacter rubeus]